MKSKISKSFYKRDNVVQIAKDLLGKYIFTNLGEGITSGIITETEAYCGITDKASHAYGNRRTARTEIMYLEGGVAYIYLCYGIHSLFNIVTNKNDIPHAVLIRGIKPVDGIDIMLKRSKKTNISKLNGIGPGNVSKLLNIHFSQSGESLSGNKIWLEDRGIKIPLEKIIAGPRVGVDYAGEDAFLPYRFRYS
ncbi:MAG: DNA-3-methyladenine glycosylase [Bacteroidetes bacterium]|nr:DNA-3-methyladenine glycosylase [Bacteroidota bacterium]